MKHNQDNYLNSQGRRVDQDDSNCIVSSIATLGIVAILIVISVVELYYSITNG